MYARVAKPKLSLNISNAVTSNASLPLKSPMTSIPRSPLSPVAPSPRHTMMPPSPFSSRQQSTFAYTNSSTSCKGILKKTSSRSTGSGKRIQFKHEPVIHPITPIENPEDCYGGYVKMSKDERRWSRLSSTS